MRLRKRAAGLLLGAAVLFLIGTNVQAGWLYVIAALLLGVLAAGLVLPFAALRGLSIELAAPEEAEQGIPTIVELRVRGPARGVRRNVTVRDTHLEPVRTLLPPIRRRERVEVTTLRTPRRRGEILTVGAELRSDAPFGVAERRIRAELEARTLVLPRVFPLGPLSFVEPIATNARAVHEAPRRGQGPDYLSVREYRPGDPMRHVHWALTARHGRLMVREFEEERTRRLVVVVDTERDEGEAWTPLDRCCSVAASVLDAATAHGQGARLIAARPGLGIDVLPRADRSEMFRWLAKLEPSGVPLDEVLAGLGPEDLRGIQTLVIAFPNWGGGERPRWDGDVRRLVRLVPRVVCVLAEPGAGEAGPVAEALSAAGADVCRWGPADDLAEAMSREEVRA
jgi:uncharacterized protein (DUF58 family)